MGYITQEKVQEILGTILGHLGLDAEIKCSMEEESIRAELKTSDPGRIIGREGRGLEALQYIVQRIAGRLAGTEDLTPIVVDVDGYRRKRENELRDMASEIADRVVATGQSVLLGPMPSWERKIVHMAVRGRKGIESASEDSEKGRRVRIKSRNDAAEAGPDPDAQQKQD